MSNVRLLLFRIELCGLREHHIWQSEDHRMVPSDVLTTLARLYNLLKPSTALAHRDTS
jgi:hypothetical protein